MSFPHNCNKTACDHQSTDEDPAEWSLFCKIDTANLTCLNETSEGSCKKIFRAWEDRLSKEHSVESEVDQELLFNIPFSGTVKLKSIVIIGTDDDTHPYVAKLYKNRPHMTFDDTSVECDQEIELVKDPNGLVAYPLKQVKFSSVSNLSLYIPRNYGNDDDTSTSVYFIGLKGEFMAPFRQQVVITSYESQANPADHKVNFLNTAHQDIS